MFLFLVRVASPAAVPVEEDPQTLQIKLSELKEEAAKQLSEANAKVGLLVTLLQVDRCDIIVNRFLPPPPPAEILT